MSTVYPSSPAGIALDSAGTVYLANQGSDDIEVLTLDHALGAHGNP